MLTFYADLDGSGEYLYNAIRTSFSHCPGVGHSYFSILRGAKRNVFLQRRSDLDYLKTGKAKFARDHNCVNLQVSAEIAVPVTLVGTLVPYDVRYGTNPTQWVEPVSSAGYAINDVIATFGTVYDSLKRMVYRAVFNGLYAHQDEIRVPLAPSRSYTQSYCAYMGSSATSRFYLESVMSVTYPIINEETGRRMQVFHLVGCKQIYDSTGKLRKTQFSTDTRVVTTKPTLPGGTKSTSMYLTPSKTWNNSLSTLYENPPILSSMSMGRYQTLMSDPTQLFGATTLSPLLMDALDPCDSIPTPSWIIATFDQSPDAILRYNESLTRKFWRTLTLRESSSPPKEWQEIGDTAADNINSIAINTLAYVRDLKTTLGTLRATVALAKNPGSPEKWASWWLSARYGDRLTYRDTLELSHAVAHQISGRYKRWNKDYFISKAFDSTIEYSESDCSHLEITRHLKLYFRPQYDDWFGNVVRSALKWDIWPTLENSWDLIPFSFVVDWFVDVQSALESIDRSNLLLLYKVLSVVQSEKKIYTYDDSIVDDLWVTNCSITAYERQVSRSLPTSPFRIDRGHLSAINIVDGISLIYQAS